MAQMTWSPWHSNPLDYVGRELVNSDGNTVVIEHCTSFEILINGVKVSGNLSNIECCHMLNAMNARIK